MIVFTGPSTRASMSITWSCWSRPVMVMSEGCSAMSCRCPPAVAMRMVDWLKLAAALRPVIGGNPSK